MKNLAKSIGLILFFCSAGCNKNDPTCLPYEGVILQETNPCVAGRTMLKVVNKNVNSIYYNGADTIQNVVAAVFPDTAFLKAGQKIYFDYDILEGPYGSICFALFATPRVQVEITRLSYQPCSAD